jgi:hypothetical protein
VLKDICEFAINISNEFAAKCSETIMTKGKTALRTLLEQLSFERIYNALTLFTLVVLRVIDLFKFKPLKTKRKVILAMAVFPFKYTIPSNLITFIAFL